MKHPGARIRDGIIPLGGTVTDAAEKLGVGRPALSNMLNGNAALSWEMALKIEQTFGLNADELMGVWTPDHDRVLKIIVDALNSANMKGQ